MPGPGASSQTPCFLPALLASIAAVLLSGEETAAEQPLRLREVYVPFEAFAALKAAHPGGIVMEVEEYRSLVMLAVAKSRAETLPLLPPLESAVVSAEYHGAVRERTARFSGTLKIEVARDGWLRCDLGPPLPSLGTVTLDGEPGWLVVADEHAYLLLRGRGPHELKLTFSLPVTEEPERAFVAGPLPAAATASLELEVPGRADGRAEPAFLETIAAADQSRFRLALGSSNRFHLEWRGRKTMGENPVLLAAEHRLTFLPRADGARFGWLATVTVARQRTDSLRFQEPAGLTVVEAEGPLLHSWERREGLLQVTLKEPATGQVELFLSGVAALNGERFTLVPPRLVGAYSNRGYLALADPQAARVTIESTAGLVEAAAGEAAMPAVSLDRQEPRKEIAGMPLLRLFSFSSGEARLEGSLAPLPARFEARAAFLLRLHEGSASLHGRLQVEAREGSVYALALSLPAAWKLTRLDEIGNGKEAGPGAHHLRFEEVGPPAEPRVRLFLERAVTRSKPLELEAHFENVQFQPERDWDRRELEFAFPAIEGAERSRADLAISLASSLDLLTSEMPGWQSLAPEEAKELGLDEAQGSEPGAGGVRLVALLRTEAAQPGVRFVLGHRSARGEYRAVTHLLAAERKLRLRSDIRLVVADRGIDELAFVLPPLPETVAVTILGEGIKEIAAANAAGTHTVRFTKPWLGARQFRIEYEIDHVHGRDLAMPGVELGGGFGGERFLVLQGRGAVEVESAPGPGLAPIDADDIPDFAEGWSGGRVLAAYRFRQGGEAGTLRTTLHGSAPVLAHLARRLALTTVIGRDGTSRTQAEILLAYSRSQYLGVELPAGSRFLAARVNDEPVTAVLTGEAGARRDRKTVVSIPLPPRSYATVALVYEEPAAGPAWPEGAPRRPLGGWGRWSAQGPVLSDIPVGETSWQVFHPRGYRFFTRGGNMRPADPGAEARVRSFAHSFFGRLLSGRLPILTVLGEAVPIREEAAAPELTEEEVQGARETVESARLIEARLVPDKEKEAGAGAAPEGGGRDRAATVPRPRRERHLLPGAAPSSGSGHTLPAAAATGEGGAPLYRLLAQGLKVASTKLGGAPRLELGYQSLAWWYASKRAVFLAALLVSLALAARPDRRLFWRFAFWGLFLGTAVPVALAWESPLLAVPFCEGVFSAVVLVTLLLLGARLVRMARERASWRALPRGAQGLAIALALGGMGAGGAAAEDKAPPLVPPFDSVIIPYPGGVLPLDPLSPGKVFLPEKRFRELWLLAHPEASEAPGLPYDLVLGNAEYKLSLEGERYRLTGTIPFQVFTNRWVSLELPFDRAQLVRIELDGAETGVSQAGRVPFIELKGSGRRRLALELAGEVESNLGEFKVATRLLKGTAAVVEAELPAGAEVRAGGSAPGAMVSEKSDRTVAVFDLGQAEGLALSWSMPKKEGQSGSQAQSVSYSALVLGLDGFEVRRRERLEVTGIPLEKAEYRILGNWEVADVSGPEVSEWSVVEDASTPPVRRLKVFFSKPLHRAELAISGRAVLEGEGPLATLALEGAARQETFVGLYHGAGRRFLPNVLGGMRLASRSDVAALFPLAADDVPDRVYQAYSSAAEERLAATRAAVEIQLSTEAVALLQADRLLIFARSRYLKAEPGAVRHQVILPAGWSVRRAQSDILRSWQVEAAAGGNLLVIELKGRARAGTEVVWSAEQKYDAPPEALPLPFLRGQWEGGTKVEETVHWTLAAGEELDITTVEEARWERLPLDAAPAWVGLPAGNSYRLAFRSKRPDAALAVGARRRGAQVHATVVSFARLAEDFLHLKSHFLFQVRRGGRDRFRLRLPPDAELLSLETQNQRSRSVTAAAGGTEIEVELQSPVTSEHAIDLVYRVRRDAGGATQVLPVTVLDGAERMAQVNHYAGVVVTARTFAVETEREGLVPVEPESLPYLPEGISARSLGPAFRATGLDWSLRLTEKQIEMAARLDAVIELADITTLVGNDGTTRSRVIYTLRNRGLQFLAVELPPGAELWGVTVNGERVAVGQSQAVASGPAPGGRPGRALKIPVEHAGKSELPLEVALYYEERRLAMPAVRGSSSLRAPRLLENQSVEVVETIWGIQLPSGYWVSESSGKMRQVPTSLKHAEKLKRLLEEEAKIVKASKEAGSRLARERGARDLARLEQALGDNLAELEVTNRSAGEVAQAKQVGMEDLRRQWALNDKLINDARGLQKELREEREKKTEAVTESADEQAFSDRANFLQERKWRAGRDAATEGAGAEKAPGRPDTAAAPAAPGLKSLLEETPFRGWSGLEAPAPREAEEGKAAPVEPKGALAPLPEAARPGPAPGLEPVEAREGDVTYTFRLTGGDAALRLNLTRQEAMPRLGALAAIVLALALAGRRHLRRR